MIIFGNEISAKFEEHLLQIVIEITICEDIKFVKALVIICILGDGIQLIKAGWWKVKLKQRFLETVNLFMALRSTYIDQESKHEESASMPPVYPGIHNLQYRLLLNVYLIDNMRYCVLIDNMRHCVLRRLSENH